MRRIALPNLNCRRTAGTPPTYVLFVSNPNNCCNFKEKTLATTMWRSDDVCTGSRAAWISFLFGSAEMPSSRGWQRESSPRSAGRAPSRGCFVRRRVRDKSFQSLINEWKYIGGRAVEC